MGEWISNVRPVSDGAKPSTARGDRLLVAPSTAWATSKYSRVAAHSLSFCLLTVSCHDGWGLGERVRERQKEPTSERERARCRVQRHPFTRLVPSKYTTVKYYSTFTYVEAIVP